MAGPATIPLVASASDPDGTVVRVDFFEGATLIGTSTASPFIATWANVPAGTYMLTARATDNAGAMTTSASVSITVNSATALVITSPADGAAVNIDGGVTISGTYEATTDSTIIVDDGDRTNLATITGNAFTATLPLSIGATTVTVRLSRRDKSSATRSISVTGYGAPVVAFTGPACTVLDAPASVTLSVDAKAPGGTISKVDFFEGAALLGTATAPPYTFTWTNVPQGIHTVTASALSNNGATGTAASVVTVNGANTPPTVSITSPSFGASFTAPASIPITVNATDPDGSVSTVEYLANGEIIHTTNVAPFSFTWSNVGTGTYSLTARATDNRGGQTTSVPVNITVGQANTPPTATVISPTMGASFSVPGIVTLTASASDPDGSVVRVDYYSGTTLIGGSSTPPYAVNWTVTQPGTYTVIARAVDNGNGTGDSPPVNITITGSITYLHTDFAGSPIAATDVNGAILWKENFRPYGDRLNNHAAASGNRQWFHGKPTDADTGLSYFGARYYDPTLGRFMGVDAILFTEKNFQTFNRYTYGNNNPYKFVDPDGNAPLSVFLVEVAKHTGVGYVAGVAADAISQYAAFGQVDLYMAATSNAAIAGGATGLLSGAISGSVKGWIAARAANGPPVAQPQNIDALTKQKNHLERVITELRQQLDNGRALLARIKNKGGTPNPHGLEKEVTKTLPAEIKNAEQQLQQVMKDISNLR